MLSWHLPPPTVVVSKHYQSLSGAPPVFAVLLPVPRGQAFAGISVKIA